MSTRSLTHSTNTLSHPGLRAGDSELVRTRRLPSQHSHRKGGDELINTAMIMASRGGCQSTKVGRVGTAGQMRPER